MSEIKLQSEYIESRFHQKLGKTCVYGIYTTKSYPVLQSYFLGEVKFLGIFRKYGFVPAEHSQFDVGCLKSIMEFISCLELERKTNNERSAAKIDEVIEVPTLKDKFDSLLNDQP